jgi:hypothetical protein
LQVEGLEDRNLQSFEILGTLGTTVVLPTGTAYRINDFEPDALHNRGEGATAMTWGRQRQPGVDPRCERRRFHRPGAVRHPLHE